MESLVTRTLEIYAEFEREVQLLHAREPLWQPCTRCVDGYCCRSETVPVMRHEWERLVEYVKTEMPAADRRRLQTNIDKGRPRCPFLMRDRCSVYPVRTWTCRIYPYTISDHRIAHGGEFIAPFCRAYAPVFNSREDSLNTHQYTVCQREPDSRLVKIRINTSLEFWVIDITAWAREFADLLPRNEQGVLDGDDMHNWVGVVRYLRDNRQIDQSKFLELLGLD